MLKPIVMTVWLLSLGTGASLGAEDLSPTVVPTPETTVVQTLLATPLPNAAPVAAPSPVTPSPVVNEPAPSALPTPALPVLPDANATPLSPTADLRGFAIGLGYPDLRLRGEIWGPLDAEMKASFTGGAQALGARLYYQFLSWGPLGLDVGGEGGWITLNGLDGLTGDGSYEQVFAGAHVRFARRWGVSLDAGPAWIQLSAQNQSQAGTEFVVSTAIYLWLF